MIQLLVSFKSFILTHHTDLFGEKKIMVRVIVIWSPKSLAQIDGTSVIVSKCLEVCLSELEV